MLHNQETWKLPWNLFFLFPKNLFSYKEIPIVAPFTSFHASAITEAIFLANEWVSAEGAPKNYGELRIDKKTKVQ